eukprot:Hpha_TRINITY_DN16680_c0_g1::TRINITY_DN16680_c0_g1_i2::g.182283::m.182283
MDLWEESGRSGDTVSVCPLGIKRRHRSARQISQKPEKTDSSDTEHSIPIFDSAAFVRAQKHSSYGAVALRRSLRSLRRGLAAVLVHVGHDKHGGRSQREEEKRRARGLRSLARRHDLLLHSGLMGGDAGKVRALLCLLRLAVLLEHCCAGRGAVQALPRRDRTKAVNREVAGSQRCVTRRIRRALSRVVAVRGLHPKVGAGVLALVPRPRQPAPSLRRRRAAHAIHQGPPATSAAVGVPHARAAVDSARPPRVCPVVKSIHSSRHHRQDSQRASHHTKQRQVFELENEEIRATARIPHCSQKLQV